MRTQPIPVFDPAVRSFDWQTNVAFNVGIGLRIFLTRYLTFFTEFRAYLWHDQFATIDVAPDGYIWFSQLNEHKIGRIDPDDFSVQLIPTPFSAPRRLRFDSKGRLWIPGFSSGLEPFATSSMHRWPRTTTS